MFYLVGNYDLTQLGSRVLNPLLKVFLSFNCKLFLGGYLVYNHILSSNSMIMNVLLFLFILCVHRFSRVKFRHRRYIFIIFVVVLFFYN